MSHHFDTIEVDANPNLDISDVYCFGGKSGTVFVIDVEPKSPAGVPASFHPDALYEFKIDTNRDAVEDLTFRVTFTSKDLSGRQQVKLVQLSGNAARDRSAEGKLLKPKGAPAGQTFTGQTEETIVCSNGVKLFTGRRGEPFFIEFRVITEVRRAMRTGTAVDLSTYDPNTAQNLFGDSNVTAIVVEVPSAITGRGTIGFWGTSVLPTDAGGWRQVNRAAGPLINTIWDFPTFSGADYNTVEPKDNKARFGPQVVEQTAAVVRAMNTHPDPVAYAEYVRDVIFADVLRYKVGTVANYGPRVQNGKGLTESAPESIFEFVLNKHIEMGLDASDATGALLDVFPYLSEPL